MKRLYYQTDSAQLASQVSRQLQTIPGCAQWRFQAMACEDGRHFRKVLQAQAPATMHHSGLVERWLVRTMLRLHAKSLAPHPPGAGSEGHERLFLVVFVRKQDERRVRNVMSHLPICPLSGTSRRGFRHTVAQGAV